MILSRILMVLALAVLAFLVWLNMNGSENFKSQKQQIKSEHFTLAPAQIQNQEQVPASIPEQNKISYENFNNNAELLQQAQALEQQALAQALEKQAQEEQIQVQEQAPIQEQAHIPQVNHINYERFADISGIADSIHGAAPFGSNTAVEEGDMATVKYTGMVDGNPGDVIQIEGTDLLTAPLVDNMLYTNSIANTNRNASQDLRGDIPLQFNDTYTPFYSSVIYGAPLSQKTMTIGTL